MTLWLPPVRSALFLYPVATISVLILLALIFKFAQAGGTVGLMTGGVLALYVMGVIVGDTTPRPPQVAVRPISVAPSMPAPQASNPQTPTAPIAPQPNRSPPASPSPPVQQAAAPSPPTPPEPRTLLASQGALLKFVAGVPYHLKVRTGFTTSLRATQGKVALTSRDDRAGECVDTLELPMQAGATPYQAIDRVLRACGADAIMTVSVVR